MKALICRIFGHKYWLYKHFVAGFFAGNTVKCIRCQKRLK